MKKINKEKIADKLKAYIDEWENSSTRMESGYDYERTFVEMMKKFEQELFQESMGKLPGKNRKKSSNECWIDTGKEGSHFDAKRRGF